MSNHKFYRQTNSDKRILNNLDSFIQSSLDKFQYSEYPKERFEVEPEFSKLLTSYKSFVPDLVIFNKKFNKNECFYNANPSYNNPYPRMKFSLKAKIASASSMAKSNSVEDYNDDYQETGGQDEEDPQWLDCNVEELKDKKLNFQSLPRPQKLKDAIAANDNNTLEEIEELQHNEKGNEQTATEVVSEEKEDLFKQLESFFSNEKGNSNQTSSQHVEAKKVDNDWEAKLNLFKDVYDVLDQNKQTQNEMVGGKVATQLKTEENTSKLDKLINEDTTSIKEKADISKNEYDELIAKFSDLSANLLKEQQQITKSPEKEDEEKRKPSEDKAEEFESSIEHNLGNLKNLLDEKEFADEEQWENKESEIEKDLKDLIGNESPERKEYHYPSTFGHIYNEEDTFDPNDLRQAQSSSNLGLHNPHEDKYDLAFAHSSDEVTKSVTKEKEKPLPLGNFGAQNFLENPISVIIKNLFHKGWVITLTDTEKVINCFTSFELYSFYENEVKNGRKIDLLLATDYDTDMCFFPSILYETIRDNMDKLRNLKKEQLMYMQNNLYANKMGAQSINNFQGGPDKGKNTLNSTYNHNQNIPGNTTAKKKPNEKDQKPNNPLMQPKMPQMGFNPLMNMNYQYFMSNLHMNNQRIIKPNQIPVGQGQQSHHNPNTVMNSNPNPNVKNVSVNKQQFPSNFMHPQMQNNYMRFPMQQFPYSMMGNQIPNTQHQHHYPLNLNVNFNIVNNDIKMNNIMINPLVKQKSGSSSDKQSSDDPKAQNTANIETTKIEDQKPVEAKKEISKVKEFFNSISSSTAEKQKATNSSSNSVTATAATANPTVSLKTDSKVTKKIIKK